MKIRVELAGEKMGNNEITKAMIKGEMGMRFEIEDNNSQSRHVFVLNNTEVNQLIASIDKVRVGQHQIKANIKVPIQEMNEIIEKLDKNTSVKINSDIEDCIVDVVIPVGED